MMEVLVLNLIRMYTWMYTDAAAYLSPYNFLNSIRKPPRHPGMFAVIFDVFSQIFFFVWAA